MNTRAKFQIPTGGVVKNTAFVSLRMIAVTEKPYDAEGKSEDNDFARWTPTGVLEMTVTNPALFDTFKDGQKFYLDLTEATA